MNYVIKHKDGSISVTQLVSDASIEEVIKKWSAEAQASVDSYQEIDPSDVPEDRTFRNAWIYEDGFSHDMEKAKDIKRDQIRLERQDLLKDLDTDYLKALELSDATEASAIAVKKQALRDSTKHPLIDSATTVEDLKKITLSDLIK